MPINSLISPIKTYWRQRVINRYSIPLPQWRQVIEKLPILHGLAVAELNRLRDLSTLFLHYKSIYGVQNLSVTEEMRLVVAAQASLLILYLDLDDYRGWRTVLLYPGAFIVEREEVDEIGVVHAGRHPLIGESWDAGPVILSWDDVARTMAPYEQHGNVVIHEFAHKLDIGNGTANGMPPLHRTMNRHAWTTVFSQTYKSLGEHWAMGKPIPLDPYALTSPAEFFAVASEAFFTSPQRLLADLPQVYQQLQLYYRQNPAEAL
jgi:Mlc titration factor MtfA (ptsG expression regulator)